MLRFLSFLFGKSYEPCKGCEVLKQQLAISNENNKELTTTLLGLLNPKIIEQPAREVPPLKQQAITFSQRREQLEKADRQKASVLRNSRFIARPDEIEKQIKSSADKTAGAAVDIASLESELAIGGES